MQETSGSDPYSIYSIATRSPHDLVVARYLRDALDSVRKEQFEPAESSLQKAKDLSPDYYEVHKVEAWLRARQGKMAAARSAYEAAIELAPDVAPLRHFFGGFLMRIDETEEALGQFLIGKKLDPQSIAIQIECARMHLYLRHFDQAQVAIDEMLMRDSVSERNQRIMWDLALQVSKRRAEYLLNEQENLAALEAIEGFRVAWDKCPRGLIDIKMAKKLEDVAITVSRLLRHLTDSLAIGRLNSLQDWLELEMTRTANSQLVIGSKGVAKIVNVQDEKKFGFVETSQGQRLFFHRSNLLTASEWSWIAVGRSVSFVVEANRTSGIVAGQIRVLDPPSTTGTLFGTVRKLLRDKSFGFIESSDRRDLFFHRQSLVRGTEWPALSEGTRVSFEIGEHDGKECAKNVSISRKEP